MRGLILAALAGAGAVLLSGCTHDPELSQRLYQMGAILRDSAPAPTPATTSPGAGMACFLRGQAVSGLYRNCVYSCGAAGNVVQTIGSAELCPIALG